MPSERLQYIDIAKGVAIISIVLLHFSTGFIPIDVNVFIGSYMISMFYVTSGWVNALQMHQLPFKAFLYKRWYQLGVPYIAWTLIILTFDVILWIFDYYNLFLWLANCISQLFCVALEPYGFSLLYSEENYYGGGLDIVTLD